MMSAPRVVSAVLVALVLTMLGCRGTSDSQVSSAPAGQLGMPRAEAADPSETGRRWVSGTLPSIGLGAVCDADATPVAPSKCDWASSADAVFYGTLLDVKFRDDLFVEPGEELGTWLLTDCSDGIRLPALVLRVAVEGVLYGAPPEELDISIGYERLMLFGPRPTQGEAGEVVWLPSAGGGGPLSVGQTIGVAAYYLSGYGTWSVLGESLFTFAGASEESATSVFQADVEGCTASYPGEAEGLTMASLMASAEACGATRSAAAEARRAKMLESWGPHADGRGNPVYFAAGKCLRGDDSPEPGTECVTDADCSEGACLNGYCRL